MPTKNTAPVSIDSILNSADAPKVPQVATGVGNANLGAELVSQMKTVEDRTKTNYQDLVNSDKIEVSISPMYKPYFGEVMAVGLNGLFIYVPCDGKRYSVPRPYAAIIATRVRGVDDTLARRTKLADVQETHVGQLSLVPR